jgi:ABC-2 type transport system ATP-binding protein
MMKVMNRPQQLAIDAQDVVIHFGKIKAVDGVSLSAEQGKVTALLGPNGAGKTTLIKALTTLLRPQSGNLIVDGIDVIKHPAEARKHIGLAGQFAAVDDYLTGRETLRMVGRLYHLPKAEAHRRADEVLQKLGLEKSADRQIKTYSGGMRRRIDLGASLVAIPDVLFLDEPTTGLDPRTRLQLWEVIRELVNGGTTILLTTQYLEEADALADMIYVIDRGKMIAHGTASELKNSLGKDVVELRVPAEQLQATANLLKQYFPKTIETDPLTSRIKVRTEKGSDDLLRVAGMLKANRIKPEELSLHRPSLDDVFLSITEKDID